MGYVTALGGGGVAYNFTIAGYATVGAIPASANENDIAIVTPNAIPQADSGGIIFMAGITPPTTRLDGTPIQANDVRIATGIQTNVPLAISSAISVAPQYCEQYTGSAWVQREAYVRKSGAWVRMRLSLYKEGNEQNSVTGGWSARAQVIEGGVARLPGFTKGADRLTIMHTASGANYSGVVEVANNIDVTAAKKLKLELTHTGGGHTMYIIVTNRSATDYYSGAAAVYKTTLALTKQTIELDVTALTGTYNIAVGLRLYGPYGTVATTEVFNYYLE